MARSSDKLCFAIPGSKDCELYFIQYLEDDHSSILDATLN